MQAPPAESVSENRRQRTRKWLKAWLADIQEFYAVKEDFLNLGDAVNDGKYDTLETFLEVGAERFGENQRRGAGRVGHRPRHNRRSRCGRNADSA